MYFKNTQKIVDLSSAVTLLMAIIIAFCCSTPKAVAANASKTTAESLNPLAFIEKDTDAILLGNGRVIKVDKFLGVQIFESKAKENEWNALSASSGRIPIIYDGEVTAIEFGKSKGFRVDKWTEKGWQNDATCKNTGNKECTYSLNVTVFTRSGKEIQAVIDHYLNDVWQWKRSFHYLCYSGYDEVNEEIDYGYVDLTDVVAVSFASQ